MTDKVYYLTSKDLIELIFKYTEEGLAYDGINVLISIPDYLEKELKLIERKQVEAKE
jgi:hypothetical protein